MLPFLLSLTAAITLALLAFLVGRRRSFLTNQGPDAQFPSIDGFDLLKEISRNRFNAVFKASGGKGPEEYAIKIATPEGLQRLSQEQKALESISSPFTSRLCKSGTSQDGNSYLATELVRGPSLDAVVRPMVRLPDGFVVAILKDVCRALTAIHNAGFAHMDIKPSNVILEPLDDSERAVVIDFGIARPLRSERDEKVLLASASPAFAAPEALKEPGISSARSDLYSLGCLAYFLASSRLPFEGRTDLEVAWKQLHEPQPNLREHLDSGRISSTLIEVIDHCMQKEPAQRPESATQVLQTLEKADPRIPWTRESSASFWQEYELSLN